jgi:hypothetical protein
MFFDPPISATLVHFKLSTLLRLSGADSNSVRRDLTEHVGLRECYR